MIALHDRQLAEQGGLDGLRDRGATDDLAQAFRHHEAGRKAEVAAICHRILETPPDHPEALRRHGAALELLGRLPEAEAVYRQVLACSPITPSNGGAGASPVCRPPPERGMARIRPRIRRCHCHTWDYDRGQEGELIGPCPATPTTKLP